ncbi:succinyldiaminopimelate transaminase [Hydrogenothermus marinus]|uniref:Succinyldiaminopimelate transaminase n=1 Tax=Hydrogenothermus marinus TaxID=133270 RepID=A0A3M0BDB4_9AQUI|nr:succinyldiaminopimelate transaminase [Hydrogenothermus marinus]RMA92555.1 succinyldiaminopimelate transaminase [Hydrogenothermus marinus]
MNNILKSLRPYPMDELNRIKQSLKEKRIKIYDFGTGDPKEPTPFFIREAVQKAIPEVSQYPTVAGKRDLRVAISDYIKRRFGVRLSPDKNIIPSNGSKEAIFHFPLVFIDPSEEKKTVIFGTPAYPVYERGALFANADVYPIQLKEEDKFLLRLDKIPEEILKKTKIVWINYPHNPTGAVVNKEYLQDIYDICNQYNIILCSDECYIDLYFEKKPPSILEIGTKNVVAFHSLSKRSGMTGYRSGFVAGDEDIIQTYKKFRTSFGVATPEFIQEGAKVAWEDDNHVKERIKIFKQKRDLFIEFFDRIGLEYLYPQATFYFWVKSPTGIPAKEYVKKLLENGIVVSIGENFCAGIEIKNGSCKSEFFRIALVPTVEECKEAINVWEKVHYEIKGA